jgi:transposase
MKKRYTEEFKQQVADLYNKGNKSISKLESEYGASKSSIHD